MKTSCNSKWKHLVSWLSTLASSRLRLKSSSLHKFLSGNISPDDCARELLKFHCCLFSLGKIVLLIILLLNCRFFKGKIKEWVLLFFLNTFRAGVRYIRTLISA